MAANCDEQCNPLTNFDRANNIARSSRSVVKLQVSDHSEALKLVRLGTYAKVLGNGITVIDFGSRVGEIRNEYKAGGQWERELFIESSSFALSTTAGTGVAWAGSAALTFLVAATPVGWVGIVLVVGAGLVAAGAAGTSIAVNKAVQSNSGAWYDTIMKGLQ